LPALEKAVIDHGLQPSDFVIAKDEARGPRLPLAYRPEGTPPEYAVRERLLVHRQATGRPQLSGVFLRALRPSR
jgi:hypothetical protein